MRFTIKRWTNRSTNLSFAQSKWDCALGVPFYGFKWARTYSCRAKAGDDEVSNLKIMHLIKIKCSVSQELSVSHYLLHKTNLLAPHPHTAIYSHACPKAACSLCACMNACTHETRVSAESKLKQKIKALTFAKSTRFIAETECLFLLFFYSFQAVKRELLRIQNQCSHHWHHFK